LIEVDVTAQLFKYEAINQAIKEAQIVLLKVKGN